MRVSAVLVLLLSSLACAGPRPAMSNDASRAQAPPPVLHVPGDTPAQPRKAEDLTYLVEVSGLGLFADERVEAERVIASWAERQGLRVVSVDRAAEVFERARLGQHAQTGAACGRPITRFVAEERWRAELGAEGRLRARVQCDHDAKTCTLRVAAYEAGDHGGDRLLLRAAKLDPAKEWRDGLAAAVAALAEQEPSEGGGGGVLGMLGGLGGGVVEARPERLGFSVWPAKSTDLLTGNAVRDALTFAKGQRPLRACFAEDRASADLLLEVGERGRVTRCEARGSHVDVSRCACDAFVRHGRAAAPLRGRRAFVGVQFTPADLVTSSDGVVTASVNTYLDRYQGPDGKPRFRPRVSDESIEQWRPPADDAIERCFADVAEPGTREALVEVRFDARGDVAAVDVRAGKQAPLSDEQKACLLKTFAASRAPCPAVDGATASASVRVVVREVGSKIESPFAPLAK